MSADLSGLRMKAELNNLNNEFFCPGPHCAQGNLIPLAKPLFLKEPHWC